MASRRGLSAPPDATRRARGPVGHVVGRRRVGARRGLGWAVVIVAGGSGTEARVRRPQGTYPIGPVLGREPLQIHAREGGRALSRRHVRMVPLYLMTSPENTRATRPVLRRRTRISFGLAHVRFFVHVGCRRVDPRVGQIHSAATTAWPSPPTATADSLRPGRPRSNPGSRAAWRRCAAWPGPGRSSTSRSTNPMVSRRPRQSFGLVTPGGGPRCRSNVMWIEVPRTIGIGVLVNDRRPPPGDRVLNSTSPPSWPSAGSPTEPPALFRSIYRRARPAAGRS